jgi:hypothetical protein
MLVVGFLLALVIYIVYVLWMRQPIKSANASFTFLVFFYLYGVAYDFFLELDVFQVEHLTLFPLFVLLAFYGSWFISKINMANSTHLWNNLTLIVGALVVYNVVNIFPDEMNKMTMVDKVNVPEITVDGQPLSEGYPDIYFIVFDEFAGFEPMRKYWKYDGVDEFAQFLKSKGFFIAEQSHGSSTYTLHQLSERLNYEEYPCCGPEYHEMHYQAISDNKVMQYLKSKGYSTVVFDEAGWKFPAKTPVNADLVFQYDQVSSLGSSQFWDEFGILVANNTMMRAFSAYYATEEVAKNHHKNFIYYTLERVAQIDEVSSPKFLYIHMMLPHTPFMFDENGDLVSDIHHADWNYYLGQYKFSIRIATEMVNNILNNADPNRPPVIILQSDHGARNQDSPRHVSLVNYPEEYKSHIMYTLYLPGYDISNLPQDIDPINTFPIVFNYLFNDNIPLK